ncbi:hypothetical protein J4771_01465 [Candidatus Kaistella beijingensis]|uniref:Piwi domain-containing protein n=1 Tax=Candidatus Kaistella beijingensis TaxID=2820270 RepID=UPI001CC756D8|nr:Piwi domain-containing protein [Candidatus Kaistella beijingensis]UBB90045.1 hypothetical protein J4771_01465 [Candidatus Kaistella beijingensis]
MPESLHFNILTFTDAKEKHSFWFTQQEDKNLYRFRKDVVPLEVIEHFGEQEFYYTSFTVENTGFYPVEKSVIPEYEESVTDDGEIVTKRVHNSAFTISMQKKFYNWQIQQYFRAKGCLVKSDYILDSEVWIQKENKLEDSLYNLYDRFTLRVQFQIISKQWELVLIYDGVSKIFKQSLSDIDEDIPTDAYRWLLFEKEFYHYQRMPDKVARNLEKAFPIWNLKIRKALNETAEKPDTSNKYFKFKEKITFLIKDFLKIPQFEDLFRLQSDKLLKVPEYRVGGVRSSMNDMLFGEEKPDYTPLFGITKNGPFDFPKCKNIHFIYFVHEDDKDIGELVHRYFNKKFDNFPGIEQYTGKKYFADKELGCRFKDKENPWPEINEHITNLKTSPDVTYVAIYISPFSRDTATFTQQGIYFKVKQALLNKGIVCQVLDANHAREARSFVYNAINLSIAINAKLNGTPWRLDEDPKDELIVGVGAFHNRVTETKYIASAFSFDNTGKFNRFDHFFENQTKELAGRIKITVKQFTSINPDLKRLVIHFYKTMKQSELAPIEKALHELDLHIPIFIVSVNKTESTDYIAFDEASSLLMPYSGTWISFGENKYLLFNNIRYRNKTFKPSAGYPFPLKIKIDCNDKRLLKDQKTIEGLLEQVYQFSRMYWKSFRQQNLPVTLKYSAMIAEMVPYFEGKTIPDFGKDKLWFL